MIKPYKTCFNKDFYDSGINTLSNRFPLNLGGFKQEIAYDLNKGDLNGFIPWIV